MKYGVVFPQTEIGNDRYAIRDYAQAVEGLGYDHILAYDHVLGASTANRPDWNGPYTHRHTFHEIFVLFGYLAGLTRTVELVTDVVILPQRQTALVAKQAAELDVLSGGRLRLGVGLGWNAVEYEALNEDFHTRGARLEEQIQVMRALWSQPIVTFHGKRHRISEAGINPLPVQQPIPVWFGGSADPMLKRAARLGDGWFPLRAPDDEARRLLERLRIHAHEAGRAPQDLGIEALIQVADGPEATWTTWVENWTKLGATHLAVNTMRAGFRSPQEHIDILRRMAGILGVGK
ncbi:MAG TPA: LLM class F420-dependent oxidoreductase [Aggregatilineales bacterium]|nr:LLM class F420-dependent oxidoreductase [Aggregatilineales bacterium]